MARTATLAELRTLVRQRADIQNSTHITDPEIDGLLNSAITEVYDLLVAASPPDFYAKEQTYNVTTNVISYTLPTDFYKLRYVWVEESGRMRPILPMQEAGRYKWAAPTGGGTIRFGYIPYSPKLAADGDTFDGINGWEELAVLVAAIDCLNKQERDPASLMAKRAMYEERVTQMTERDVGAPERIIDRTQFNLATYAYTMTTLLGAYRVRGGNVEFYAWQPWGFGSLV